MSRTAILQCGDLIENHERVLSACKYLQSIGVTPRPLVYSDDGAFFAQHGVKVLKMKDARKQVKNVRQLTDELFDDIVALERSRSAGGKLPKRWTRRYIESEYTACALMLERAKPDFLIVWNGYTGHIANILRVLKREKCLSGGVMERGIVRGSVYFDPLGVNGDSLLGCKGSAGVATTVGTLPNADEHDFASEWLGVSREAFIDSMNAPRENVVFVPLQVQSDTNIVQFSEHIRTMRELVLTASLLAHSLGEDWRVVVRRHPEEDPKLRLNLPTSDNIVHRSDTPLDEEMRKAKATLTINSTVGLEVAMAGGFVMTMGEGVYCKEAFVHRLEPWQFDGVGALIEQHYADPQERYQTLRDYLAKALGLFHFPVQNMTRAYPHSRASSWFGGADTDLRPEGRTLHELAGETLQELAAHEARLDIDTYLSPADKISITYRTANVPVSEDFIGKSLTRYVDEPVRFVLRTDHLPGPKRIAIAPVDFQDPQILSQYAMVFDPRMTVHAGFKKFLAKKYADEG